MPETSVHDSETTKKCSNDFNLLFESIPRFNKDIKEGPIFSIRKGIQAYKRYWTNTIGKQGTQLARFYRLLTGGLENPKKCFCQGSLSFRTILHEVAYSTISSGRTYRIIP